MSATEVRSYSLLICSSIFIFSAMSQIDGLSSILGRKLCILSHNKKYVTFFFFLSDTSNSILLLVSSWEVGLILLTRISNQSKRWTIKSVLDSIEVQRGGD